MLRLTLESSWFEGKTVKKVVVQKGLDLGSNEKHEILPAKESMNLNFMDGEEINEVVDLVSIGR